MILSTDAVGRMADRHLLDRFLVLNQAARAQWLLLLEKVQDPETRDLLQKAITMNQRVIERLAALLTEFQNPGEVGR